MSQRILFGSRDVERSVGRGRSVSHLLHVHVPDYARLYRHCHCHRERQARPRMPFGRRGGLQSFYMVQTGPKLPRCDRGSGRRGNEGAAPTGGCRTDSQSVVVGMLGDQDQTSATAMISSTYAESIPRGSRLLYHWERWTAPRSRHCLGQRQLCIVFIIRRKERRDSII